MFLPLILAPYAARILGADGLGEIGGEIIVQDIHQYSEEYLQAMAEQ